MAGSTTSTLFPDLSERYNRLRPPGEATRNFRLQLSEAFLTPEQHRDFQANPEDKALRKLVDAAFANLLCSLGPLFWEEGPDGLIFPKYEIWLIHGHYEISDTEKMVSRRERDPLSEKPWIDIMDPEPVPFMPGRVDRWDYDGKPLEFSRSYNDADDADTHAITETEPPEKLQKGFRRVMAEHNITALGLSVAPPETTSRSLSESYRFVESTGLDIEPDELRSPRRHVTRFEKSREGLFQIAWLPPAPSKPANETASYLWLNSLTGVNCPVDLTDLSTILSMCNSHCCPSCLNPSCPTPT